jgi:hypothetical protein
MYKKYGLIPQTENKMAVPLTIQTFTVYALLAPMLKKKTECTALTVRRKQGMFSMHVNGNR